jgi:hypothetical protein
VLAQQPLKLRDRRVPPPQLLLGQRALELQHALPLRKLVGRLRRVRARTEVDHHLRAPALLPRSPRTAQLMLGSRVRRVGGRAEALPKHTYHDVGVLDLHLLVDQPLRTVQMHPRPRVDLPAPQRQPTPAGAATPRLSSSTTVCATERSRATSPGDTTTTRMRFSTSLMTGSPSLAP